MLNLDRKVGQSIIIGDGIAVYVVSVRGGTVKLGISAPRDVTVYREEIHRRIRLGVPKPCDADEVPETGGQGSTSLWS